MNNYERPGREGRAKPQTRKDEKKRGNAEKTTRGRREAIRKQQNTHLDKGYGIAKVTAVGFEPTPLRTGA